MPPSNKRVPAIRFSGFVEEWRQRIIGDVLEIYHGKDYKNEPNDKKLYPVVGTGGEIARIDTYLCNWKCVCIGRKGTINKPQYFEEPFWSVDTLFYTKPKGKENPEFQYYLFLRIPWISYNEASGVPSLNAGTVEQIPIAVTSLGEQARIGQFFRTLDKLIELRKKEVDKMTALKKELLNKLFPQQGQKIPAIRFSGFVEEWRNLAFGDTFCFLKNNTLSRAELVFQGHGAQNIHYGDILIKFGTCLEADKEEIPFIRENNLTNISAASYLREGDIIIADTAEDSAVGKCCEIIGGNNLRLVAGLHTIPCRPQTFFSPAYLGYYLNSPSFHDQLLPLMQGIKVIAISKSAIILTNVRFPSINEQSRIGQFFRTLDKLIELRKKEVDKMTALKKELLNKLFVG